MDININVRLQKFNESATSAKGSVKRKRYYRPKTESVDTNTGISNIINGKLGVLAKGALSVVAVGKLLNTANRIEGSITGNRFQERRRSDLIKTAFNSGTMFKNIITAQIEKHYDTIREFEKTDYRRQLTGLVMPFRESDSGMRL